MSMRLVLITLITSLSCGCKPAPKISTYEVNPDGVEKIAEPTKVQPKPIAQTMQSSPAMQDEAASFGSPQWATVPVKWISNAPNPMRKGSWSISGESGSSAEIAVTVFPGDVGGLTANVNRWRGQLGLSTATEAEINASTENINVGKDAGKKIFLTSTDQRRVTIALLVPKNNATWFCKISGDATIVKEQSENFLSFFKNSQLP